MRSCATDFARKKIKNERIDSELVLCELAVDVEGDRRSNGVGPVVVGRPAREAGVQVSSVQLRHFQRRMGHAVGRSVHPARELLGRVAPPRDDGDRNGADSTNEVTKSSRKFS